MSSSINQKFFMGIGFASTVTLYSTKNYCRENKAAVFISMWSGRIEFLGCQELPNQNRSF